MKELLPPTSEGRAPRSRRRYLHWLAVVVLLGALARLCWPSSDDSVRAIVVATVADELGAGAEVVELEWFEARPVEYGIAFEALARVSGSQPGDLHADRYQVRGKARSSGKDADYEVEDLQLTRLPYVPPEPRP